MKFLFSFFFQIHLLTPPLGITNILLVGIIQIGKCSSVQLQMSSSYHLELIWCTNRAPQLSIRNIVALFYIFSLSWQCPPSNGWIGYQWRILVQQELPLGNWSFPIWSTIWLFLLPFWYVRCCHADAITSPELSFCCTSVKWHILLSSNTPVQDYVWRSKLIRTKTMQEAV